jgi:hypothetical protein
VFRLKHGAAQPVKWILIVPVTGRISKESTRLSLSIGTSTRIARSLWTRVRCCWTSFLGLNPDSNGMARRESYIQSFGSVTNAVEWFPAIKDPAVRTFGVTEFATSKRSWGPADHGIMGLGSWNQPSVEGIMGASRPLQRG